MHDYFSRFIEKKQVCMIKTHGKYHLVCGYTLSTLLPFNKAFEKYMKTTNKYIKWGQSPIHCCSKKLLFPYSSCWLQYHLFLPLHCKEKKILLNTHGSLFCKQPTSKPHQLLSETLFHWHSAGKYVLNLTRHIFQNNSPGTNYLSPQFILIFLS